MDNTLSVRIINIDSCMCAPIPGLDVLYSEFRASAVNQVPILRIFGATATGEKICLHIHGVFPYLYIPYDGAEDINNLMYRVAASIDKAVNISLNQASSNVQHIYKVMLVSGIPMYGYHPKKHQFLKIYLYNPLLVRKVSNLLLNYSTLGMFYQPHESHLNFTLQFMIDYNLHGMNNINVSEVKFRGDPVIARTQFGTTPIPADGFHSAPRTVSCALEADVHSQHILNRQEVVTGRMAANPGIAALWADERQRRRDHDRLSQMGTFLDLGRKVSPTDSHNAYRRALQDRLSVWVTNADKEETENNNNVYPAEMPEGASIQNSSVIDSDLPSSADISYLSETSLNDSMALTQDKHATTLDDDALKLLDVLNQLAENVNEEKEDDCILSQTTNDEEEDDEKEVDMTLPLEAMITPKNSPRSDFSNDNIDLDKTLIPQVDGMSVDDNDHNMASPMFHKIWRFRKSHFSSTDQRTITSNVIARTDMKDVTSIIKQMPPRKGNKISKSSHVKKLRGKVKGRQSEIRETFKFNMSSVVEEFLERHEKTIDIRENLEAPVRKILKQGSEAELILSNDCQLSFRASSGPAQNNYPYLSLDGVVDDSSSDEETAQKKNKKPKGILRKSLSGNFSKYSALPATCTTADGSQTLHKSDKKCEEERPSCSFKINDAKRKLDFSDVDVHNLSITIVEEKLDCRYSPARTKKSNLAKTNYLHNDDNGQSPLSSEDANHDSSEDCSQSTSAKESSPSTLVDSDSENGALNISFFHKQHSAAAKYDEERSSKAKEGCSNTFTPHSQSTNKPTQLSSASFSPRALTPPSLADTVRQSLKSSSEGSELTTLTPYQRITNSDKHLVEMSDKVQLHKQLLPEVSEGYTTLKPSQKAPSRKEVFDSLDKYKIAHLKFEEPYYSNYEDVSGSMEIGFNVLKIKSKTTVHLPEFESQTDALNLFRKSRLGAVLEKKKCSTNNILLSCCNARDVLIMPVHKPPTFSTIVDWIKKGTKSKQADTKTEKPERLKVHVPLSPGCDNDAEFDLSLTLTPCSSKSASQSLENSSPILKDLCKGRKLVIRERAILSQNASIHGRSCEITGLTNNESVDFDKSTDNMKTARAVMEYQNITLLIMEQHIRTRGDLKPDPTYDPVEAIFYTIFNDVPENSAKIRKCKGAIVVNTMPSTSVDQQLPILNGLSMNCDITYVNSEHELLEQFVKLVEFWDPDIVAGYEIEMLSWGYLIDRGNALGINLNSQLGRCALQSPFRKDDGNNCKLVGRIVLDVWRLMRHEIALQSYTFESVVYSILQKRIPCYSFKDLTFWWSHKTNLFRHRTACYYFYRVSTILELLDKLDLIGRTSELARLFGIQFYEVLSRGSQFRVESMMLRLAKPLNFIPVSPSVMQRAKMKAPEYIPLILEPESKLYNDPVIVLDFQSLYPSIIIAYNYCFTTCLGRMESLGRNTPFEFGATQLKVSRARVEKLLKRDLLNFSPCGVTFVKREVRDGIMPRMLREILDTRLMVKNSMKENKDDSVLQKVLHNRQLGLKLIANVTYGYTAANFSGRMPSVEVGDSVVSKGRETLQRAIDLVENTPEWGAKVVYGDTDSLFVCVPGRSRQHAFEVGALIADAVTKSNPDPVKLKLEKVYQPCILQTKKRYVGYMYESSEQNEPVFEAKGIETVRRDGCPAVSKMLEKCLKILFDTKDVSLVKKYVLKQFTKILAGRASIQDLTFAKEYRGASGYRQGACVPALELARKWKACDRRSEPRSGQRVPYIVVNGPPGLPVIRLVRSPRDLLNDPTLKPNALYYITKVIIPPINRCFNLIGADVQTWFHRMPRKQTQCLLNSVSPGKKTTIAQYFSTANCLSCGEQTQTGICFTCTSNPQKTAVTLMEITRRWEQSYRNTVHICQTCTITNTEIKCISLDCPVLYRRVQTERDTQQTDYVRVHLASCDFF